MEAGDNEAPEITCLSLRRLANAIPKDCATALYRFLASRPPQLAASCCRVCRRRKTSARSALPRSIVSSPPYATDEDFELIPGLPLGGEDQKCRIMSPLHLMNRRRSEIRRSCKTE